MRLLRRDNEFTIALERTELMSTRASGSEEALARLTCARLGRRPSCQILVGGYGLGYTLRALLAALAPDAGVVVAEIVPEIIAWARDEMKELTSGCLDDPRVILVDDDVAMLIDAGTDAYDAILLDVDNGPEGLTRRINDLLYGPDGLAAAWNALRPGGILAVWSVAADAGFTARLDRAGFLVDEVVVPEISGDDGAHHLIWFAQKP